MNRVLGYSDGLGSSADGTNSGITLSGLGNTAANDVAHFEDASGGLNKIIGEKITSGNEIIGRTVTKLGFKLYRMDSGTFSSSDTLTFGVWDNATGDLKTSGSFGTVRIDSLEYNSASNVSHCKEVSLTHSGSGVTIEENDIIGIRIDIDNASAKRVEVAQHDTGSPYANGGRCLFTQGADSPTSVADKDIWFRVYQGKLGTGAYSFDGTDDYVSLGSTTDWSFLSQADAKWTITGWYSADNFSSNQALVGSSDFGTNDAGIMIRLNTDRTFRILLGKDSTDRISHITTLTTPNDTDWHFLCVQYDDSIGTLSISVDGGSVETDTGNNLTNTTTPDNPLQFGWNGHSLYFDGKLDDMGIWKRVLTATEIGKLANNNASANKGFYAANANQSCADGKFTFDLQRKVGTDTSSWDLYDDVPTSANATSWTSANTVSDSQWTLRGKIRFTSIGANENWCWIALTRNYYGFTSNDAISSSYGIGAQFRFGTSLNTYYTNDLVANGTSFAGQKGTGDNSQNWTPAENTDYYLEIKRTSTTSYSVSIYTGDDFSTGNVGTITGTCSDTITKLKYIKVMNTYVNPAGTGSDIEGYVSWWKFYDGTNSPSGTPTKTYEFVDGDAQLVSSLTDKSNLKAYYSFDDDTGNTLTNIAIP